ncbi:MAG: hypothetical protein R2811_09680 [Flavobacteriales bacterium]
MRNYDDLNSLFFQVLARKPQDRSAAMANASARSPASTATLFSPPSWSTTALSSAILEDERMPLRKATVLRTSRLKRLSGTLPALDYLFRFLDAYDFTSEGGEEVQEENKRLISASVLGLTEGRQYKDGSFFTPGFITMYMCREAHRPRRAAPLQHRIRGRKLQGLCRLNNLRDRIESGREALRRRGNRLINGLHICDPPSTAATSPGERPPREAASPSRRANWVSSRTATATGCATSASPWRTMN